MRAFTIGKYGVESGIECRTKPIPHIGVGEEGRAREYAILPLGREWRDIPARIERASVVRSADGRLRLVPERPGDEARALVALQVPAGYRGYVLYRAFEQGLQPCPKRGAVIYDQVDAEGRCPMCHEHMGDRWVHPADVGQAEWYLPLEQAKGVKTLLRGYAAQGIAGRMGGGPEYLVIMEPGARLLVLRGGRLYGAPPEMVVEYDGERVTMIPLAQAEAADAAQADEGELV